MKQQTLFGTTKIKFTILMGYSLHFGTGAQFGVVFDLRFGAAGPQRTDQTVGKLERYHLAAGRDGQNCLIIRLTVIETGRQVPHRSYLVLAIQDPFWILQRNIKKKSVIQTTETTHGIFPVEVPDPLEDRVDLDGIVADVVGIARQMLAVRGVDLLQLLRDRLVPAVEVSRHGRELEHRRHPVLVHHVAGAHEPDRFLETEDDVLALLLQIQRQIAWNRRKSRLKVEPSPDGDPYLST